MCGISGIFNTDKKPVHASQIESMNNLINHRGPDGNGVYVEGNLGIGSTRLAIIDLREIANQPMSDTDGRYVIVYNGEIFNYVELRNELLKKGYRFNNNSDTEVILNSYKEYGEDCLHKLNGMWAFAIWDKREKSLFCSRDRYGIKPFYYYKDKSRFVFGSEIKQILDLGVDKTVNDEIIYDYLVFNFIDHTEQTFFKNVQKLPAGWKLKVSAKEFKLSKWYELPQGKLEGGNLKTLYRDFYNLVYDSVRIRLRSDVEVGSCLSGGLDSSCVSAAAVSTGQSRINTYTVSYPDNVAFFSEHPDKTFEGVTGDDTHYSQIVADRHRTRHMPLLYDLEDYETAIDRVIWHREKPLLVMTEKMWVASMVWLLLRAGT